MATGRTLLVLLHNTSAQAISPRSITTYVCINGVLLYCMCRLVCTRVILLFLLSLVLLLRGLPLLRGSSVLRLVLLAAFCPAFRPLPHHNHKPPPTFTSMHASRALAMLCLTTTSPPSPYPLPAFDRYSAGDSAYWTLLSESNPIRPTSRSLRFAASFLPALGLAACYCSSPANYAP